MKSIIVLLSLSLLSGIAYAQEAQVIHQSESPTVFSCRSLENVDSDIKITGNVSIASNATSLKVYVANKLVAKDQGFLGAGVNSYFGSKFDIAFDLNNGAVITAKLANPVLQVGSSDSLVCKFKHGLQNSAPVFANLQLNGVTRNMTTINPRFSSIAEAQVTFNNTSLQLTLTKKMPICPAGRMCAMAMPAPIEINLAVRRVVQTECSIKYIAATPPNVKSTVYEEVTLEDFTQSKCMTTMELPYIAGVLTYKVSGVSVLTHQQETATATFNVDGGFIRAQN